MASPIAIQNKIAECYDGKGGKLSQASIWYLIIHRLGVEIGHDACSVTDAFADTSPEGAGHATGGRMPYHFLISPAGVSEQCIPLDRIGAHAMKWNSKSIGIACLGDFRLHALPDPQERALIDLCAMLRLLIAGVQLIGHTDLPEASSDPLKICPGKNINLPLLRAKTAARTLELSGELVANAGLQLIS